MLYADDAGVVSQSSEQLRKMIGVIAVVCAAFGLTVSEAKTEIMCLRARGVPESTAIFSVETAGQVYVCMYGHIYSKSMDQPGKVANPARGQLNRVFDDDSTTVSSAWELTSVSMHYSQGNGVHTPLSRACTVHPRSVSNWVCESVYTSKCITCMYPRHGYVLYG